MRLAGGPPLCAPHPGPPTLCGLCWPSTPRTHHALPAADVRGEADVPSCALRGHRWRLGLQAGALAHGRDAPRGPSVAWTPGWEGGLGGPVGSGGEPDSGPVTSPWALRGWQGNAAGRGRPLTVVTAQSRALEAPDQVSWPPGTRCPPSGLTWTTAPPQHLRAWGGSLRCPAAPGGLALGLASASCLGPQTEWGVVHSWPWGGACAQPLRCAHARRGPGGRPSTRPQARGPQPPLSGAVVSRRGRVCGRAAALRGHAVLREHQRLLRVRG